MVHRVQQKLSRRNRFITSAPHRTFVARQRAARHISFVERLEVRVMLAADAFEPNESETLPADLGRFEQFHQELTIDPVGDQDWYRWSPFNSGDVTASIFFEHGLGDVDMVVYEDQGEGLITRGSSTSTTDNESVTWNADFGAEYFIHVYGWNNATHENYQLHLDMPGQWILPDGLEDAGSFDNDTLETAFQLPQGNQVHKSLTLDYDQIEGVVDSADWYHWQPFATGILTVQATFRNALSNVDIELWDTGGLLADSSGSTDLEQITWEVIAGESYYVHVFEQTGNPSPGYDLLIEGPEIVPDGLEPNDNFQSAIAIGSGDQLHTSLGLHTSGEEDWYEWVPWHNGTTDFEIRFDEANGDLQLELYNDTGELVQVAVEEENRRRLSWQANSGEKYRMRVASVDEAVHPNYELQVWEPDDVENYAVLFSGGIKQSKNYRRYYDNTRDLYDTLVDDYDLDPDNIYVLFADGTDPAKDRSDNVSSDLSFAQHVLSATPANLQTTLTTTLANRVDGNDHVLFWSFDHGGGTHLDSRFQDYSASAATTSGEEVLSGWGKNQDVEDQDLASWLNQVPAGLVTLVFTQCFAGGMLDNLLPLAATGYGMAATNHYEFSYGDDFAAAFREALEEGHGNTNDAYIYAHDHDSSAATRGTYTDNAGAYSYGTEHPWSASNTNFPIFHQANIPPVVQAVLKLPHRTVLDDLVISHDMLAAATASNDSNSNAISFRIESVDAGTMTVNGDPVVPRETIVAHGESVVWQAPPEVVEGTVEAFSIRAFDGSAISTQRITVPVRLGDPETNIEAIADTFHIPEDQRASIPVLDNDEGDEPRSVESVGQPQFGRVELFDGQVLYTPTSDWTGTDTFTYFMSDANGEVDATTVTVIVDPRNDVPVAQPDYVVVQEDSEDNLIDVIANDYDADFDPLLAIRVVDAAHGALRLPIAAIQVSPWYGSLTSNEDGSFYYTPHPDYVGPDSFTYVADDGLDTSNEVTVWIQVEPAIPEEQPDLTITDIWEEGGTVHYQLRNIGNASALPGYVVALAAGDAIEEDPVDVELEPGQRLEGSFDGFVWSPSTFEETLTVTADDGLVVAESDEDNNTWQETWRGDTQPPQITQSPVAIDVASDSVTIVWETNEPSDSRVVIGGHAHDYPDEYFVADPVTYHSLHLIGLQPAQTYHYSVESTDISGNRVVVSDMIFRTAPLPDVSAPDVSLLVPLTAEGNVAITSVVDEDQATAKVEFYVDGDLKFTDYSEPFEYTWNTKQLGNGLHLVSTRAIDVAGNDSIDSKTVDVANEVQAPDVTAPNVTITTPTQSQNVSGDVTIRATLTDDTGLASAQMYIDGVYTSFKPFNGNPTSATLELTWDSTEVGNGGHRIGLTVFDKDSKATTATVDVVVNNAPPAIPPKLIVNNHTVRRNQNVFYVELTVSNVGGGAASNVQIVDSLRSFQPIEGTTILSIADNDVQHDVSAKTWESVINVSNDIPAGASQTIGYLAIPVLTYPQILTPDIGQTVYVNYESTDGADLSGQFKLPILKTHSGATLSDAHAASVKEADFLITTNPQYLHWHYGTAGPTQKDQVDTLLSDMAQLAVFEHGALGYLYTTTPSITRSALDKLVEPSGTWAKQLDANFSKPLGGYMMIVGETEIIPAWTQGGFQINWGPVKYSDHPYADTGGSPEPDLIVGRVIGDSPSQLSKPIRASYARYTGQSGYDFDRDQALLISGPGLGSFVQDIKDVQGILQSEYTVTPMHWGDYYLESSLARDFELGDALGTADVTGDARAEIIVVDKSLKRVYVYDAGGTQLSDFAVPWWNGTTEDGFTTGDVTGDTKAEIILADSSANKVWVFNSTGGYVTFLADVDPYDGLATGDVLPHAKDEIILADRGADKIKIYSANGVKHSEFARQFDKFDGLAAGNVLGDTTEEIVLADWSGDRFYVLTAAGILPWSQSMGLKQKGGQPSLRVGSLSSSTLDEILISPTQTWRHLSVLRWDTGGEFGPFVKVNDIPFDTDLYDAVAVGDIATLLGAVGLSEIVIADEDKNRIYIVDPRVANFETRVHNALNTKLPEQDVIYWSGHGNISLWDGGIRSHDVPNPVFPIDFVGHNPVVLATSCRTGDYETSANEHKNIAESFLDSGAAVYIGSTQDSNGHQNREGAKKFFQQWQPMENVGQVFTELERSVWSGNQTDHWWFWVWEHNIYGDPKFGDAPQGSPGFNAVVEPAQLGGPVLDVTVPDYVVSTEAGMDFVDIPGGEVWQQDGQHWIPYYPVQLTYPAGQQVQDVMLTGRDGLVQASGLNIPVDPDIARACNCEPTPSPGTEDWFPALSQDFTWQTTNNADGSTTLTITLFPFHYNSRTTDVEFYQNYSFDISTTESPLAITELRTNRTEYAIGEQVVVDLSVANSGLPEDVVVEALIKKAGDNAVVDGLLLQTLFDLTGSASFSQTWTPGEAGVGNYFVETTLKDSAGRLLVSETHGFQIGLTAVGIASLDATPGDVSEGTDEIQISLEVANTGSEVVSDAVAVIRAFSSQGDLVLNSTIPLAELPPTSSVLVNEAVDISGLPLDSYHVVGHVMYDSTATAPSFVDVGVLLPPRITQVLVGSSTWSTDFRTTVLSETDGFYPMPSDGNQLKPVPWPIDQIRLVFSEDVNYALGDLQLYGTNQASIGVQFLESVSPDRTATWRIDRIHNDKIALVLSDAVAAIGSGLTLDGDYTTADGLPSGNGSTGGDFEYRINVLSGDADQSGSNSLSDLQILASNWQLTSDTTNMYSDFDGSGEMSLNDLQILATYWNVSLPLGDPMPLAAAPAAADVPSWPAVVDQVLAKTDNEVEDAELLNPLATFGRGHRRSRFN